MFDSGIIMWETDSTAQCFPVYAKDVAKCPFNKHPWNDLEYRRVVDAPLCFQDCIFSGKTGTDSICVLLRWVGLVYFSLVF